MHPETPAGDAVARRMIRAYRLDAKRAQRAAWLRSDTVRVVACLTAHVLIAAGVIAGGYVAILAAFAALS